MILKLMPKHWYVLKTFYNGKKVLIIPSLPINNKLISDFEVHPSLFASLFFKSKKERNYETENVFYFTLKALCILEKVTV